MLRLAVLAWVALATSALPVDARAQDVHLDACTAFQAYEVRSPGAAVFLVRRRLVQSIDIEWSRPYAALGSEREPGRFGARVAGVALAARPRDVLDRDAGVVLDAVTRDITHAGAHATWRAARGSGGPGRAISQGHPIPPVG